MIVKTEAIVLKSMKYRDTSKIVTFYSREYGKIKCIAKGARTAKNKFGSSLEPFTKSMLLIYKKEHQELHLISQCDAIESFKSITEDLDRMSNALMVLELIHQVTHEEERNPALYALLTETLGALNAAGKNHTTLFHSFRIRLASIFGYAMELDACNTCRRSIEIDGGEKRYSVQIAHGAVYCNQCRTPQKEVSQNSGELTSSFSCSAPALQILRRCKEAQLSSLPHIEYSVMVGNEIDEFLRLYIRYHFEGSKPLKSREFIQQLHTMM